MYLGIFDEKFNFFISNQDFDQVYTLLGQKNLSDEDIQKYFLEVF